MTVIPSATMSRLFLFVILLAAVAGASVAVARPAVPSASVHVLPPARAVGVRYDTLLLGGYADGSFEDAVRRVGSELSEPEKVLVGHHLGRIFRDAIPEAGLGRAGRLKIVYERSFRSNGTIRSIRVLAAEVAASGRLHTAYYFEQQGVPGYFDAFGRPLEPGGWEGPLATLRVNSAFGDRRMHPILQRILPHTGVDLAAAMGQPVRATADGVVALAGNQGGYGLLVELGHGNGYSTRYAHLSSLRHGLESGGMVRRGDVIGFAGMSGLATGPHLHYEVLRRGQPMDPMRLAADPTFSAAIGAEPRWPIERRRLGSLLARAPTFVSPQRRSDSG